jgi:hypothetical protein
MQLMAIAEFIIGRAFARPVGSTTSRLTMMRLAVKAAVMPSVEITARRPTTSS